MGITLTATRFNPGARLPTALLILLAIPTWLPAAQDGGTNDAKNRAMGTRERQTPPPATVPSGVKERQPVRTPTEDERLKQLSPNLNVAAQLVTATPLFDNTVPVIAWHLTNQTHARSVGVLKIAVDAKVTAVYHSTPPPIALDPNGETSGQFMLPVLSAGTHTIHVSYSHDTGQIVHVPDGTGKMITAPDYEDAGATDLELTVLLAAIDLDHDGIDDHEEHRLLETYRPYFKFSKDGAEEHYNPADVTWYITQSELLPGGDEGDDPIISNTILAANPLALLTANVQNHDRFCTQSPAGAWACASDLTKNPRQTAYSVNPLATVGHQGGDPGRHGNPDWSDIQTKRNVGLYGHVAPDSAHHLIKIEYWQFFGYNNANQVLNISDHEGDWTTVQLLYDPSAKRIVNVTMFAHGNEMPFNIGNIQPVQITDNGGLSVAEYRDPARYNISDINIRNRATGTDMVKQNLVRIYTGASGTEFHPVVYIEYGAHEFWPSEHWVYIENIGSKDYYAPPHNGLSYTYLTNTPPNLGEVEHPLTETPAANLILRYNGLWGAYSKRNSPPQGPPLHNQWMWPADSSIRWQLPKDLGN